jgi:hypothetical protein
MATGRLARRHLAAIQRAERPMTGARRVRLVTAIGGLVALAAACAPASPSAPSESARVASEVASVPPSTAAALPPGRLVFDRLEGEFGFQSPYVGTFVLDLETGVEQPVNVDYEIEELKPSWSTDGTQLQGTIFAWPEVPGRPALMEPDGSHLVLIDPGDIAGSLFCTSMSVDETAIACSYDDDALPATEGIYTLAVDGSALTQITVSPNPGVVGPEGACSGNDIAPAFYPDAEHVAFIRTKCGTGPDPALDKTATIGVVGVDGIGLVEITEPGLVSPHDYSRVSWSPSGERLAFAGADGELFTVYSDGSDLVEVELDLDVSDWFAYTPTWSPDGSWILFSLWVPGNTDLYIVRPDGSDLTRITQAGDAEVWASWTD